MPIAIQCPKCSARMNAPDAAAGKRVACPKCKSPLVVPATKNEPEFEVVEEAEEKPVVKKPAAKASEPPKQARATAVVDDDDDDDEEEIAARVKKKKKKQKPQAQNRGLIFAAIGIVAVIILGGGAFFLFSGDKPDKSKDKPTDQAKADPKTPEPQPKTPEPQPKQPKTEGPSTPTVSIPADWIAYAPTDSGFEAKLPPKKPFGEITNGRLGHLEVFGKDVVAGDGFYDVQTEDAQFSIRVIQFSPKSTKEARTTGMEKHVSLAVADWEKSAPWKKIQWLGYDARERSAQANLLYSIERWFVTDTTGYVVRVASNYEDKIKQNAGPFFSSFKPKSSSSEGGRLWIAANSNDGSFRVTFPGKGREIRAWNPFELQKVSGILLAFVGNEPPNYEQFQAGVLRYKAEWDAAARKKSQEDLVNEIFKSAPKNAVKDANVTVGQRQFKERRYEPAAGSEDSAIVMRWFEKGDALGFIIVYRKGGVPADVLNKVTGSVEILK